MGSLRVFFFIWEHDEPDLLPKFVLSWPLGLNSPLIGVL